MSLAQLSFTIQKTHFFDKVSSQLNSRQEKVLYKMFEAGPEGFEGGMSSKKYCSLTQTSKSTATRDLQELFTMGAVIRTGEGRNTRYKLSLKKEGKL